jgi:AraC-like DNA-binding protein
VRHIGIITEYDPRRGVEVSTLAYEYPPGFRVPEHAHGADQLIYAVRGVMQVSVGRTVLFIPPNFALWIPARAFHHIHMPGAVSMRTLYLRPGLVLKFSQQSQVLHVTPLLRELIVETVRLGQLRSKVQVERALRDLLIARLESASPVPASVTMPGDPRAIAVAQAVLADPARSKTLAALCAESGVGVRTLERLFRKDAGMDFESWRRQVRLMKAVELLVSGQSVKEIAAGIGYRQSSAFVQMFRRAFGTTPKAWVATLSTPH